MLNIDFNTFIPRLISIAVIIAVMCVVLLIIRSVVKSLKQKKDITKERETIVRVSYNIARGVVIALACVAILQACGINISGAVAGLGIAGIIVSFALQETLQDLMSGIRIINNKYFVLNDVIEYDGNAGVVIEMNIMNTKIKLISDGSIVSISNHLIESCRKYPDTISFSVDIPLPFELPPNEADRVLEIAADKIKSLENVSKVRYDGLISFQDSSVLYKIVVFCAMQNKYMVSKNSYRCVFDVLWENRISIPYSTYALVEDKKQAPPAKNARH